MYQFKLFSHKHGEKIISISDEDKQKLFMTDSEGNDKPLHKWKLGYRPDVKKFYAFTHVAGQGGVVSKTLSCFLTGNEKSYFKDGNSLNCTRENMITRAQLMSWNKKRAMNDKHRIARTGEKIYEFNVYSQTHGVKTVSVDECYTDMLFAEKSDGTMTHKYEWLLGYDTIMERFYIYRWVTGTKRRQTLQSFLTMRRKVYFRDDNMLNCTKKNMTTRKEKYTPEKDADKPQWMKDEEQEWSEMYKAARKDFLEKHPRP